MLAVSEKLNRYEKIQSKLADLTYATREQLQIINDLGGDRNANRILLEMERMGYIKSKRFEKKVYYVDTRLKKKEVQHILMRNDLYIKYNMPESWQKEVPLRKNGEILLIPDAMFKIKNEYFFVEIDYMQNMKVNYDKIEKYKEVSRMIFRQHKHHPTVIWYTLSDNRKEKLRKYSNRTGVKCKIY